MDQIGQGELAVPERFSDTVFDDSAFEINRFSGRWRQVNPARIPLMTHLISAKFSHALLREAREASSSSSRSEALWGSRPKSVRVNTICQVLKLDVQNGLQNRTHCAVGHQGVLACARWPGARLTPSPAGEHSQTGLSPAACAPGAYNRFATFGSTTVPSDNRPVFN